MDLFSCLSEEPPANHLALQGSEKDLAMIVATWPSSFFDLLKEKAPIGYFGKTSPASCRVTKGKTLEPFSGGWQNSGMGSPTEFLTLDISEFHKSAAECSLSDILEAGNVPPQYCLSKKACMGILRRSEMRGKELPVLLRQALERIAQDAEH